MRLFSARSAYSIGISCWIGFLACIFGCALPLPSAASICERSAKSEPAAQNSDLACCHHTNKSGSQKHSPNDGSCCSLNATFTHKQSLNASADRDLRVAVLSPLTVTVASAIPLSLAPAPNLSHTGRDILLQVHVLRL